jgi:deoxyribodipyrimidine photolyase-related protein
MSAQAVVIFPTQLLQEHPLLDKKRLILLVECERYFSDFRFHVQKLILHRATMRMYYTYLRDAGYHSEYVEHPGLHNLVQVCAKRGIKEIHYCDPVDTPFQHAFERLAHKAGITLHQYESPLFLTTSSELAAYFADKKSFRQHYFYQLQRKRLNVLMTRDGKPVGGSWSFDTENRKAFSGVAPTLYAPRHDAYYTEAVAYVQRNFPDCYGNAEQFWFPVTFTTAKKWLDDFLLHRFAQFGPYQDAIVHDEAVLFHSVLSPLLNIGLLSPTFVLERALTYAAQHKVPLASLEGFVRQLIGWREYVRGVYITIGEQQRTSNFLQHTRKLPQAYWEGSTGLAPVDDAIRQVMDYAYTHHIVRLMVLGTSMLLQKIDPDHVYQWFMELFIDAYDWVMVPNVYGMSQYADGGMITTKPYICGSSYILRMSDYTRGPWTATWDALYWYFVYTHRKELAKNNRLAVMVAQLKRMPTETVRKHIATAKTFLKEK